MTRFLIVDDDELNLRMLRVLLENFGYQVTLAQNGLEALEIARQDPPDIIVTDILMPQMDGFTLCREWKQDSVLKSIPLVFYTATYTDPENEKFALSLGAERFVIKTIDPMMLIEILREVLTERQLGQPSAPDESVKRAEAYLKEYGATLIRKLEANIARLEEANRKLQREISDRRSAEEELRQEKILSRCLINNNLDGVFAFDNDCRYTMWNPEMGRISGLEKEAVLGRSAFDVFPTLKETGEDRFYNNALDGKTVSAMNRKYIMPVTGEQVSFESYYFPLVNEDGNITGGLAIIRDITKRKPS
jgi:PAS domain S-box-containing protein